MKLQTNEQICEDIITNLADDLVEANRKLHIALKSDNFEEAALQRDYINKTINYAAKLIHTFTGLNFLNDFIKKDEFIRARFAQLKPNETFTKTK